MAEVLDQLRPELASYCYRGYDLHHDLQSIQRAHAAEVREATVFYAARALEALSAAALDTVGLEGKENAFSNLTRLGEYGLMPKHTRYWAHALRRSGNAVRHAASRTAPAEEATSLAFLEYWLRWYFCEFASGLRLPDLTRQPGVTLFIDDQALADTLVMVASAEFEPTKVIAALAEGQAAQSPAVLAVVSERLLEMGQLDQALTFLTQATQRHPDDLRLMQLLGLCHSRAGRLDEAIALLEPLHKRYRTDEEMAGIMGGVYKRKWRAENNDLAWLRRSVKAYEAGWKQDRDNTYLGINVASTSLFLSRLEDAQAAADDVRDVLRARRDVLARQSQGALNQLNLWDQLTLIEAELLAGHADEAAGQFAVTAAEHPDAVGDLTVACRQFMDIATCTGASAETFRNFLQDAGATP